MPKQERWEVEFYPDFPELVSDCLDQLESVSDMLGVISEYLSRLEWSRGNPVRTPSQIQTIGRQELRMCVGVGLHSNGPLVDKVAYLSHHG